MRDSIELKGQTDDIEAIRFALKAIDHSRLDNGKTIFSTVSVTNLKIAFAELGTPDRPFIITDKQVLLDLLELDGEFLQYGSNRLKDSNDVALKVITRCPYAFTYLSDRIKNLVSIYKDELLHSALERLDPEFLNKIETEII